MAKGKKNKQVSDKVRGKKKEAVKKVNPFEVKINKQKHAVLGRKISKHDRGMPGLSRSKGMKKRKETLLQEYNHRFKSNKFLDKRFGEHDASLSVEEKMMRRFAMERAREKSNKFSLNDPEEELTHYGQSLSQIEKFEEPEVSDEEEDEDQGRISGSHVAREHFGGFLEDSNFEALGSNKQSWKERMEELITKTRKERHERQMEKEKTREMTEKLDSEWKDVMGLMIDNKRTNDNKAGDKPKTDDYDVAVRELMFEMKGKASDRLKSEEELAKEEKERLEKLEKERQDRMRGITEKDKRSQKKVHFSADDLDDGFAVDPDFQKPYVAKYKDGKLHDEEDSDDSGDDSDDDLEEKDENDGEGEEKEPDDDDDDDDDDENEDEEEPDDENVEGDDDASDEDSYEDIESDKSEDEEEKDSEVTTEEKTSTGKGDLQKKRKVMEAARKELPYTFKAPENYEELLELLHGHSEEEQLTIVSRIRKCHHASLAEGNKQKLEVFFRFLLQYYCDLALQHPPQLTLMDKLVPHLYELTQGLPVASAQSLVDQLVERREEFQQICDRKGGRGMYPALDTLLLLKLVVILFPTSDFRHSVTTPAMIFMTQMLAQCPVRNERDIAAGLFLSSLCLEFVSLSKRYIPECVNFLHGLLFLASEKTPNRLEKLIPPFKPVGKTNDLLLIAQENSDTIVDKLPMARVLSTDLDRDELQNDQFRLSAINTVAILLKEFLALYSTLPSCREIFLPILSMLRKLPRKNYPSSLQKSMEDLDKGMKESTLRTRKPVVMKQNKPKPLRTFEPKIEEVFEDKKKRKGGSKDFNEKQKMLHKYKKEMKGAMREIRKDTQFLARQQLGEQMEKDAERKRKVKQIYQMLGTQEGEFKAMKRAKKT